ncbi:MAG: HAD family hydrolase [Halobacteriales archaeon]|nr:HAD family hydrolase [Halobacteriales archaeon]
MRIVLDYGGTVVDRVDDGEYAGFFGDGAVRYPAYVAYRAFEAGIIETEDEYVRVLSLLSGETEEDCRTYLEERKRAVVLPDEREVALRRLDNEHSLALFTDQVRVWIEETLDRFGIASLFDDIVVSSDLGRTKPHPEGYVAVRDGYETDDVVMVSDELNDDLLMADYFGMETVWVENDYEKVHFEPDYRVSDLSEVPDIL